jgi:hypothetical protein
MILEHAIVLNMKTNLIYQVLWPRFRRFPPLVLSTRRYSWLDLWWTWRKDDYISRSLQPMDERRLTHQGARHSTVDHGYPSDGVFLLIHLWVLPSRWLISLRRSPSSLSSLWMASWCEWLSPNGMGDSSLLHQGYAPWSWEFPRRIPCGCLPTLR